MLIKMRSHKKYPLTFYIPNIIQSYQALQVTQLNNEYLTDLEY